MHIPFKKWPSPLQCCSDGLRLKGSSLAHHQDITGPASIWVWRTGTGRTSRALALHCQSPTGFQQSGVTPQKQRLTPIIQFVIKSMDLRVQTELVHSYQGHCKDTVPCRSLVHPSLSWISEAVGGQGERNEDEAGTPEELLDHITLNVQTPDGSGGTLLFRWLLSNTDGNITWKLLHKKTLIHWNCKTVCMGGLNSVISHFQSKFRES